jgi:5-formyltetrahydrofolate cyclo-ligase
VPRADPVTLADHATLADHKRAMRARLACCGGDPALGHRLAGHALRLAPAPGAVVSGFWPMPGEIDPRPLLLALAGRGHAIVLPRTPNRGLPLSFHRWRPGEALVPGRMGIPEPAAEAPALAPDFLLVPLVAFDAGLRRLGRGAGFYDRTLAALRAVKPVFAMGVAFAARQVEHVPAEPHDARLDAVATEAGIIAA